MFALVIALLAGCGSTANSCQTYIDSVTTCYDAAGLDTSAYDADATCGEWTAQSEATYGDYYTCLADAYDAVDCSDSDAFAAIDISGCTMP